MNAIDAILNKKLDEVTDIEHAIIFLWREEYGNETVAMGAAAELAALQSRLRAAQEYIRVNVCDQDTTPEMARAWEAYQAALAQSAAGQEQEA